MAQLLKIIESQWGPPIIDFFIGSEKYMQPLSSLHVNANFTPRRDMIFQNFKQGVSN
jgi:hypothetical protein